MNVLVHYCPYGFSNCYIMGTDLEDEDSPRDAVVVDPGNTELPMLDFIESNGYKIRGILITHDHISHVHGLRTLRRIYDAQIYAVNPMIQELKTTVIRDGDVLKLGAITVTVITVPGHSSDSAIFRINKTLLTGDTITAGLLGTTISSYGKIRQMDALRSKVLSLPGDYVIFPAHGPPSTLEAERSYNIDIAGYKQRASKQPRFRAEFN
ncbi:MAG: MBL fold metallo-hydrolase [Spirochaetaceae bacterium]|jgi:glyoxylase-like metal-dependent hydrolase (beta-lactamase superfamily II)|nr:MBL fold metallo-hydrolase [Spirochaetaceae bacterium]